MNTAGQKVGRPSRIPPIPTGSRFGHLVVLGVAGTKRRARQYLCRCDCGHQSIVAGADLKRGNTRSCGCRGLGLGRTA
jgi:hypothetical protein